MRCAYWRSGGLAILVAAASIAFSACGGSGPPDVASLGKDTGIGHSTTTTSPTGSPSELLDEWAACMRKHGDPDQADPSIDASKVIHVTFPNSFHSSSGGLGGPCGRYIAAAQTALGGGRTPKAPDQADLVRYAACMRANGISDFPDPSGNGLVIRVGGDLNPSDPKFKNASKACAKKTGVEAFGGTPQPGSVKVIGGGPPCDANRPAGANALPGGAIQNPAVLTSFLEC